MINTIFISQLDDLAAQFEDRGELKHASVIDEVSQLLVAVNTDLSPHVNKLTDFLCNVLKIDPEEAISLSADLVEKYGIKDIDLLNMGDSEVDGDVGFPTDIFPTGALPNKERRQGPDPKLVNITNPNWWETKQGNVVEVIDDLERYSDKLKQAGYKSQAKKIGLVVSKVMLDYKRKVENSISGENIRKGMILQDSEKNLFGEVKDVDLNGKGIHVTICDQKTGNLGGITINKEDSITIVKTSKPLQQEALLKKAMLLLEGLVEDAKDHEFGPQLERIRYNIERN